MGIVWSIVVPCPNDVFMGNLHINISVGSSRASIKSLSSSTSSNPARSSSDNSSDGEGACASNEFGAWSGDRVRSWLAHNLAKTSVAVQGCRTLQHAWTQQVRASGRHSQTGALPLWPRLFSLPLCITVIIIPGCARSGSQPRRSTHCGLWMRHMELLYHGCCATIRNFDSWWRCCQRRCYANHGRILPLGEWSRGWNYIRQVTAKWPIP